MFIQNQDRDEIFTLSDKGLFKGRVYIKVKYFQGHLMGYNVMAERLFQKCLLGTYEEQDAQQIVQEIYRLLKAGVKDYKMPDAVLDPEEFLIESEKEERGYM